MKQCKDALDKRNFINVLSLASEEFGFIVEDYDDAYLYSKEQYQEIAFNYCGYCKENFLEGYEKNLYTYIFLKGLEQIIAMFVYQTDRKDVFDVYFSPDYIHERKIPTNLPHHLNEIVNNQRSVSENFSKKLAQKVDCCESTLSAIMFAAGMHGSTQRYADVQIKDYDNAKLLTKNEQYHIAGQNMCSWLKNDGFDIMAVDFTRDAVQDIIAEKDGKKYYILLAVEVAPIEPGFLKVDLDNLYDTAKGDDAIPYVASVSLGSANDMHFSDGIITFNDEKRYMVNAFMELSVE